MPIPISDDDADERDSTPTGLARRLNRVITVLRNANARLERINTVLIDPPQPDVPTLIAELGSVKTEAANASRIADEMLAKLR